VPGQDPEDAPRPTADYRSAFAVILAVWALLILGAIKVALAVAAWGAQ
jgi:hypothetical protein